MTNPLTDPAVLVVGDGVWLHFDARPPEVAVTHPGTWECLLVDGRHPASDCGVKGGCWSPRYDRQLHAQLQP